MKLVAGILESRKLRSKKSLKGFHIDQTPNTQADLRHHCRICDKFIFPMLLISYSKTIIIHDYQMQVILMRENS